MMNQHQHDQGKKGRKPIRDRYWNLMLVGDQGQIIPFRRFKGIATAFVVVLVITLIALTVLSYLYLRQADALKQMAAEMGKLKAQADQIRNEKDVLLARLVMENKIAPEEEKPEEPEHSAGIKPDEQEKDASKKAVAQPVATPSEKKTADEVPSIQKNPESRPEPPEVKPGAQIRQFGVSYHRTRSILQARFRVYNANQPKVPLSGKVIVVFKKAQDPPLKWITVPTVQISNGRPDGKKGKVFKIKNYRTVTLRAYGMKPPIVYDTAAVYVYSEKGELLLHEEHDFKIKEPPPPPPPEPTTKAPVEAPDTPIKSEPKETGGSAAEEAEEKAPENVTEQNTADPVSDGEAALPSSQDPRALQYPDPYNVPKEDTASGGDAETGKPFPEQQDASETHESVDTRELYGIPESE